MDIYPHLTPSPAPMSPDIKERVAQSQEVVRNATLATMGMRGGPAKRRIPRWAKRLITLCAIATIGYGSYYAFDRYDLADRYDVVGKYDATWGWMVRCYEYGKESLSSFVRSTRA